MKAGPIALSLYEYLETILHRQKELLKILHEKKRKRNDGLGLNFFKLNKFDFVFRPSSQISCDKFIFPGWNSAAFAMFIKSSRRDYTTIRLELKEIINKARTTFTLC